MSVKKIYKTVDSFFDRIEDHVRAWLSRRPILYALIAGVAIILFWRGIWHLADMLETQPGIVGFIFSPSFSAIGSLIILLATGLFVSFFVGDVIIISGLKRQKKFSENAEEELAKKKDTMARVESLLGELEEEVKHIHSEHKPHHQLGHIQETTTEARSGGGVQPK